ncbi:glutamate racemase [Mangrovitalea sediminis]|uniref:glutamate racemase n=1 Tax=Mangrovitalea sediminis TaxID=1982043 RepID=UPI000BE55B1B|nr:glutamate racemase [Mangrovitalea sediminis]
MTARVPGAEVSPDVEATLHEAGAPRVLVFDSGIGGLSIAHCIRQRLPFSDVVYLADNARFPYGELPEEMVVDRCVSLVSALVSTEPVDIIVIGCNTASTVVLEPLRACLSQPVVGVVPAVKPAAQASLSGRIGLLATPATVRRTYLNDLIERFAAHCEVTRVGSSELVREAEQWLATGTLKADVVASVMAPLRAAGVDTIILGCTHFPLIAHALAEQMPADVQWIDSGDAIARRVESLWIAAEGKARKASYGGGHRFYFTADAPVRLDSYLVASGYRSPTIFGNWSPDAN